MGNLKNDADVPSRMREFVNDHVNVFIEKCVSAVTLSYAMFICRHSHQRAVTSPFIVHDRVCDRCFHDREILLRDDHSLSIIDGTVLIVKRCKSACKSCGEQSLYDHTIMVLSHSGQIWWAHPLNIMFDSTRVGVRMR